MQAYVELVDETFPGFSPGAPVDAQSVGPAAPVQSTLAGAERAGPEQVRPCATG